MAKGKQSYGICIVRVWSMTYERSSQLCDGAMLPLPATARCFATVMRPHSNIIRYLCGDGEDAKCQVFATPIRGRAAPAEPKHRTGKQEQALWLLRAARVLPAFHRAPNEDSYDVER
jgi:hypothetical protein